MEHKITTNDGQSLVEVNIKHKGKFFYNFITHSTAPPLQTIVKVFKAQNLAPS